MKKHAVASIAFALSALIAAAPAMAHVKLEKSTPAQAAVLKQAPGTLELTFNAATRLVSVKLVHDGKETALPVDKTAAAAKHFTIKLPELVDGAYQARYATMSGDGHPMSGKIDFSIKR